MILLKQSRLAFLMEQVLAPRFNFTAKERSKVGRLMVLIMAKTDMILEKENVGFNPDSGQFQIEIKGLVGAKKQGSCSDL